MSIVDFSSIQIKQFVKERDEALLSMDKDKIIAHMQKWGSSIPLPELFWLVVHKARTGATRLPMWERAASKQWLISHGSTAMDDGNIYISSFELQKYVDRCRDFGLKV